MVDQAAYDAYKAKNLATIQSMLADMGCRPVLFIGSGMTRRYLGAPDWMDLLRQIATIAGVDTDKFNFLAQKAGSNPIALGTLLSDEVHNWAFGPGKNNFPNEYFEAGADKDNFIKYLACQVLAGLKPNLDGLSDELKKELASFKAVSPHAIITTNFDDFLEGEFDGFEVIVGEKIIPFSLNIVGELYKIHGSVAQPQSIVLTGRDYERFLRKRRYISSKLITYFAEYPVFIFGYSFNDENINSLISDLGEALKDSGGLLENVFLVRRIKDLAALSSLQEEHAVGVGDGSLPSLRVRTIMTTDFQWIFDTLGDTANPLPIPIKTLRHLAAKVIELVRVDVPKNKIEIDFDQVKHLSDDPSALASVLGISNVENANVKYPYSLTELGKALGYNGWHGANDLIRIANVKLGYDIKSSDNEYHMAFKAGVSSHFHKYSEDALSLLGKIQAEQQALLLAAAVV